MKYMKCMIAVILLCCSSCSSNESEEKNRTETSQERLGREATEQIKATINSAEMARQIQDNHTAEMERLIE